MFPRQFKALSKRIVLVWQHLLLQVAFIEVYMPIYIGRCDKLSCCVHFCRSLLLDMFCNGCNAVTRDANIPGSWQISEVGLPNDQVHKQFLPFSGEAQGSFNTRHAKDVVPISTIYYRLWICILILNYGL